MNRHWRAAAACANSDPELFYPADYERRAALEVALEICGRCPVRSECLTDALQSSDTYSIRGGTTGGERRKILRKLQNRDLPEITIVQ